ncbi:unnamed protein product [Alopecurus aequalis]
MDPAGLRPGPPDPAGSGAPPPPQTTEELGVRAAGSGGGAEACGSAPVVELGDLRVGILESSDQIKGCLHPGNKKDIPQFNAEGATNCEYGVHSLPRAGALLQLEPACLTLGRATDAVLAKKLHDTPLARGKENIRTDLQPKLHAKHDENRMSDAPLGLDLNTLDPSDPAELNPFFPYKKLGQSKVSSPSECGSTTGATGESESHRKWREMKQNGFLSSTHGTTVAPKSRGRPPKRKRDDEVKRSTLTLNEQTKFTKVAAPSGLLSGLNPGIINHVRNSKQVYSIIKAMVRSEELENAIQPGFACQTGERGKEVCDRIQEQKYADSLMKCHFMTEVTMASDGTCSTLAHDLESRHDDMTMLSIKAASVASQWLELLQQDIRGRLAALKRSRKRVRNALQTELPYLISTEFSSNEENEAFIAEGRSTGNTVSEAHVARWRSLFVQMDRTLQEEGRQLENRMKEVQAMLLNCDKGLKQVTCEAPVLGTMAELWKLKSPEISESEWAVQAAAASIYSTCNLVMKSENVSCF